jgi:VIT1/CCC1 family predicted Fe2+/Mn2+ transporter
MKKSEAAPPEVPMKRMRSLPVFLVAAMVSLCALGALVGCAGDATGQAKEFLGKADGLYNIAAGIGVQLDNLKAEIERLMVANDIAGLEARQAEIQDMLSKIDRSRGLIDKAIPEYEKVTKLSGVDKYKEYAALQMEAALTEQQALVIGRDLVNYVLGVIADARSGKSLSLTDALRSVSTTVNMLDELERNIDTAKREAKLVADRNNLFYASVTFHFSFHSGLEAMQQVV